MIDGAVDQAAHGGVLFVLGNVANPQNAVEVAHRKAEALIAQMLFIAQMNGETNREREHGDANRRNADFPLPLMGRDPQNDGGQRAAGHHRERKLEVGVKNMRRDDGDEHAAQRPTQRDHHVKTGEMPRVRLQARQFAMTHHAADEQRGDK